MLLVFAWIHLILGATVVNAAPLRFVILHTNDLHSQFEGGGPDGAFTPSVGDGDPVKGHYARLAALIRSERQSAANRGEPTLLLDAGDFYSGTLFHLLAINPRVRAVPELAFFHDLAYDGVSLGNHEFDAGPRGLATMIGKARAAGLQVPLLATNLGTLDGDHPLADLRLAEPGAVVGLARRTVKILKQGNQSLRVGIIGLVGPDAALVSMPTRQGTPFIGFDDATQKTRIHELIDLVRAEAAALRREAGADIVIALLHGGEPEDREIAEAGVGVDVIVSGHTHESYDRIVNGTIIAQSGHYGENLGRMELEYESGHVKPAHTQALVRLPINDAVPAAPDYLRKIADYKRQIDPLLRSLGFHYATPIATVSTDLMPEPGTNPKFGRLLATLIASELNRQPLVAPIEVHLLSMGMVRAGMMTNRGLPVRYQLSDIFRILSLGFHGHDQPGYDVVTFYLTPAELEKLIEFTEAYRHVSRSFAAAFSNSLGFQVQSYGIPMINRIKHVTLNGHLLSEHQGLVHVAANTFVAAHFANLPSLSYGLVNIVPKDANGQPLKDFIAAKSPPEFALLAAALKRLGVVELRPQ